MESKDLFLMVEAISNEKNITKECVFEALEEALAAATIKNKSLLSISNTKLPKLFGHIILIPSGATYLPADCCFSELAL